MFTQHARIRRLAARVLLVWLFALATGVVNACVVAHGLRDAPAHEPHAAAAGSPMPHEHGCANCDDEGGTGPSACAKFCDNESSSVPSAQSVFNPWLGIDIAPVPTMALAAAPAGFGLEVRPESAGPPATPVPVPIAYLRLTR